MTMVLSARWATAAAMTLAVAMPAQALNLPFGWDGQHRATAKRTAPGSEEAPLLLAQAGDPVQRINQLEEDNRKLTGRVEELSFQLLQLQEQLRKLQEDNDFRFQELEGASSGGSGGKRTEVPASTPAPLIATAATPGAGARPATPATGSGDGDQIGDLLGTGGLDVGTLNGGATPPPAVNAPPVKAPSGSGTVASVKPGNGGELYDLAYNYLLAGDYQLAEDSFRQYSQTYPDAKDVPDAQYWLGESLYAQSKYADAAETFLNAQKAYPKSSKAPEMMLKLGMSLSKLDNRDTACVTFKEVARRYPQMSANVRKKLEAESKAASC